MDPSDIATLAGSLDVGRAQELARSIDLDAPRERTELIDAATEFEAYFLKVFLAEERKTVSSGGLLGSDDNLFSSSGAEGYQALLDDALARHAARAGGIGLADQLLAQWEKPR